jgi:hypothetical protein
MVSSIGEQKRINFYDEFIDDYSGRLGPVGVEINFE